MRPISRRQMLKEAATGFGGAALLWMLHQEEARAEQIAAPQAYDLRPKKPHHAPKVKSAIYLYMGGGPSTIDMFDPKPVLKKYDGQDCPRQVEGRRLGGSQRVMASPWEFKQYGQSGRWVSELMPNFARVVDDVTFLRAVTTDRVDHSTAQFSALTGRGIAGFPSIGAWACYGLGAENQDLPAFVALEDTYTTIRNRVWGSAWLPPIYQGTRMNLEGAPIFDIARPKNVAEEEQMSFLRLVNDLNRVQRQSHSRDMELEARIANYELAARMQLAATKVADLSKETEATRKLYGLDDPKTSHFSTCCLLARRLVENGVRFVTVVNGGWDHHNNIQADLPEVCHRTDRGIAALIEDLKSRGLLESTLVIWGGEFGRLPTIETLAGKPGRDHNPHGFSIWMAGGSLKRGFDFGDTDELGYAAVENHKVTHSDVHATVLHLLGLDYRKLTFRYESRDESLIGVNPARVIAEILS